jgi:steroid delta-isomerase-like uncharacterized protein
MGDLMTKIQRTVEIFNDGNMGLIDELYASDFVNRSAPPDIAPNREAFKEWVRSLRAAFPDLHYTIDESIEAGDRFVTRLTAVGTMRGDFAGMPATGKHAAWTEIHIVRAANGQIVEHWGIADQLGMMVQLGVIPAPGRVLVAI